jgi:hypothetical protein
MTDSEELVELLIKHHFYEVGFCEPLGRISIYVTALEYELQNLLSLLIANKGFVEQFISKLHFDKKRQALSIAFNLHPLSKSESDIFAYLMFQVKEIQEKRNKYIHSTWRIKNAEEAELNNNRQNQPTTVTLSDLQDLQSKIANVRNNFSLFIETHFSSTPEQKKVCDLLYTRLKNESKNHKNQTTKEI